MLQEVAASTGRQWLILVMAPGQQFLLRKLQLKGPGLTTGSKKLLVTKGIATRSKDATRRPGAIDLQCCETESSGGWNIPPTE